MVCVGAGCGRVANFTPASRRRFCSCVSGQSLPSCLATSVQRHRALAHRSNSVYRRFVQTPLPFVMVDVFVKTFRTSVGTPAAHVKQARRCTAQWCYCKAYRTTGRVYIDVGQVCVRWRLTSLSIPSPLHLRGNAIDGALPAAPQLYAGWRMRRAPELHGRGAVGS